MQEEVTFHCMGQCPFEILQVKPTNPCCQTSTKYKWLEGGIPSFRNPMESRTWRMGSQDGRIRGRWINPPFTRQGHVEGGPTTLTMWGNHVSAPRPRMILQANLPNFSSQKTPQKLLQLETLKVLGEKKMAYYTWFEVHPWNLTDGTSSWRWMVPVIFRMSIGWFLSASC